MGQILPQIRYRVVLPAPLLTEQLSPKGIN